MSFFNFIFSHLLRSLSGLAIAYATYLLLRVVYRLTLHPLARFPGPKLAGATSLYSAYYDIVDTGFVKKLPALHEQYGPYQSRHTTYAIENGAD